MTLLKVFAMRCNVKADILANLLNHLQIAYYKPGNQWLLFPWYLSKSEPENFKRNEYTESFNRLLVVICINGYMPCVLLNRLILGFYPQLDPERSDTLRQIWEKHFCFEINEVRIYLEQDKMEDRDRITMYLSAPLDVCQILQLWTLLKKFFEILENIWHSFPGLILDCYQRCPHCDICKWVVRENIKQTCKPGQSSRCKNTKADSCTWPSSMIYPLLSGTFFQYFCIIVHYLVYLFLFDYIVELFL
jgi:hypothetical protein